MDDYLLYNYDLTKWQAFQSLFVSEYGLRHLDAASSCRQLKMGHRFIAIVEFIPIIGQLASLIEMLYAKRHPRPQRHFQDREPIVCNFPEVNRRHATTFIFEGTQTSCNGSVPVDKALIHCKKLNLKSEREITFNEKKIANTIDGGTCTAMSFQGVPTKKI